VTAPAIPRLDELAARLSVPSCDESGCGLRAESGKHYDLVAILTNTMDFIINNIPSSPSLALHGDGVSSANPGNMHDAIRCANALLRDGAMLVEASNPETAKLMRETANRLQAAWRMAGVGASVGQTKQGRGR
jgi:hypothetical protein